MVTGQLVESSIGVSWFPVYIVTQAAVGPSMDQYVKEGRLIVRFTFNAELYPRVNTVEVCQKHTYFLLSMVTDDKRIINVAEPKSRIQLGVRQMCIRDRSDIIVTWAEI